MNVQTPSRFAPQLSVNEFLTWSETKPERYELVGGRPRLLPNVKRNHAIVVSNIDYLLQSSLDRGVYNVFQGDFAIPTGPNTVRYADVLVERAGDGGRERTTQTPVLIVEVLSHSTYPDAFGPKATEYQALPTLQDYVVLEQDRPCVWHWTRDDAGRWPELPEVIEEGELELRTFGISMPLSEIYRKVS